MTKKDYELIAKSIWRSGYITDRNKIKQQAKSDMQRLIAFDLASSLADQNNKFDRNKFLTACGVKE